MEDDFKKRTIRIAKVYLVFLGIVALVFFLIQGTEKVLSEIEHANIVDLAQRLQKIEAIREWEGNLSWNKFRSGLYATLSESIPIRKNQSYILYVDSEVEVGNLSMGIVDNKGKILQKMTNSHKGRNVFFLSIRAKRDDDVKIALFREPPWVETSHYRIKRIRFIDGVEWNSLFYINVFPL